MKRRGLLLLSIGVLAAGIMAGCSNKTESQFQEMTEDSIKTGGFSVASSCHDPQIVVGEDGTYYMFGSHMVGATSSDLREWSYFANGVDAANPLFDNLFTGDLDAFSYVGKNTEDSYSVWASNVIYNETMGKYVMYFCTTSTYIKSNLCMAVADEITGPYQYVDTFLYSGFDASNVDQTNVYTVLGENADISGYLEYGGYDNTNWPNCIDPAVFEDEEGKMWLTYGSWSGGIFLLELNKETGLPIYPTEDAENEVDAYFGKRLIGGGNHSIEGPYIQYDKESGYYYLFVSYGELASDGGYQIRQFRSENPDGPYVDAAGNTLEDQENHSDYGVKMIGNYTFPSLNYTYLSPGGQSTFQDNDGNYYITYHTRFADSDEYHEPRVHQMFTNKDGWFVATPFATAGESLKEEGYSQSDVNGTFYVVDHGTDISSTAKEAVKCTFDSEGTITGDGMEGTFTVEEGTCYITITLNEKEYEGVLVEMEDEAGNQTLCITATGASNETIWCVQYLQ